jgi:hypothetical protein
MKPPIILFAAMALSLASNSAEAQRWYRAPGVALGAGMYAAGAGYGYGYGGGYSPYSQQGMADVIRARGQAAEDYSAARINNEEARSKYLDNKLKWTEVYWERKRLGEAELAKDYAEDRARREKYLEANRGRKPETLPPSQFDAQTGGLEWPDPLQAAIYADYRQQIEAELQLQANTGTSSNSTKIRNLAREMQGVLKDHIKDMSPNDYIASRKFLDRLVNQVVLAQNA